MSPTATACRVCGEECREGRSYCGRCRPAVGGGWGPDVMATLSPLSHGTRGAKAKVKRDLASGATDLIAVLLDPPASMRLDEALLAVPGCGEVRLETICRGAELYPRRKLTDLTDRQAGRLVRLMRKRGWL